MDLKIIQLEEGMGRLKGRLGAFVVEYKGSELRIGTGMTYGQRNVFWKLRDRLKGRIIEVKYSSESQDKYKNYSLQFPTFVQIRELYKLISYD